MNGLAKVFELVEDSRISPIIINICHRIRPAFDKENDDIRAASFNLFGALHRFGKGMAADAFYDQIHNNLPCLLVHTEDSSQKVRQSCKVALKNLAPLFRSKDMHELLTSPVMDPDRYLQYGEFLNDITKILV